MNIRDTDSREARAAVAAALSEATGKRVFVDKVANRIEFYEVVETVVLLGEAVEQELLAVDDPLEFLKALCTAEVGESSFQFVRVPSGGAVRPPGVRVVEYDKGARFNQKSSALVGGFPLCGGGVVSLRTYSSEKRPALRAAWLSFLSNMQWVGDNVTVVVYDRIKTYEDVELRVAQVWFDGVVLVGQWEWDDTARALARAPVRGDA